jgi:hypothetical protein
MQGEREKKTCDAGVSGYKGLSNTAKELFASNRIIRSEKTNTRG